MALKSSDNLKDCSSHKSKNRNKQDLKNSHSSSTSPYTKKHSRPKKSRDGYRNPSSHDNESNIYDERRKKSKMDRYDRSFNTDNYSEKRLRHSVSPLSKRDNIKSSYYTKDEAHYCASFKKDEKEVKKRKHNSDEMLTTRTGGAYIPPAKLKLMQKDITDKSSVAYQRLSWEALKKSINGLINKVNASNIGVIVRELFAENIIRGRGVFCQSLLQMQSLSTTYTHVYAALMAIINTKFPNIGELLLKRLVGDFRRAFKRNDKARCMATSSFIAHLVNQQVAHEVISLELLTILLETPTVNSVEVAVSFLKEVGQKLGEVSPRGIHAVFESLRHVLHESTLDKRSQYMIEVMFQIRKDGFKDNPAVIKELDLVEEEDQYTHMIGLDDDNLNVEDTLNVFKYDPDYVVNEAKYEEIKEELLNDDDDDVDQDSASETSSSDDEDEPTEAETADNIIDKTETDMISLRRTIYLVIQSSLDFEEAAHKLLKLNLKPGHETELCHMIVDCCAQQRTYEKFFGLLAQRFCLLNSSVYVEPFAKIFTDSYNTVHRLEIGKLRNVAKIFAHLLFTDSISWTILSVINLNETDTTSSSRIFIKILMQELAEYMGMTKLLDRFKDATFQEAFSGLFPRDNPINTRFAINFFTSIGLGGLTEDLRAHLKMDLEKMKKMAESSSGSSSSSDSDSSSSSSSSCSSSSSSSSEEDRKKKREKKFNKKNRSARTMERKRDK